MPALFTSPAMVPSFASMVSNRRTTSGSLATSAWTAIALRLKARTSATTAPAAASFARKFTHTSWPRSAARRAVAAPIPRLAPVMTTTDIASRGFGDAPALSPFDLLHNFQRLRDIVCGTQVADGGSDRPIRLHDERGALGEAMVDLVAARVLGARLGFADLEVVAVRGERVRLEVAAAGERRRIEVDDDRALLQGVLQREVELLAGERSSCREVRCLVAFLQRREGWLSERTGQDQPCEDTFHDCSPFIASIGRNRMGHCA